MFALIAALALPAAAQTTCPDGPVLVSATEARADWEGDRIVVDFGTVALSPLTAGAPASIDAYDGCVRVEGLVLGGIDPAELLFETGPLGDSHPQEVLDFDGSVALVGHILLGRQPDPHGKGEEEATFSATVVLAPTSAAIREHILLAGVTGATTAQAVADLELVVVDVIPDPGFEQAEAETIPLSGLPPLTIGTMGLKASKTICLNCNILGVMGG